MNQYRSLENRIRDVVRSSRTKLREEREQIEKDSGEQIVAGSYQTKHDKHVNTLKFSSFNLKAQRKLKITDAD